MEFFSIFCIKMIVLCLTNNSSNVDVEACREGETLVRFPLGPDTNIVTDVKIM